MVDVVVIGGGVVGASAAYHLAREGVAVTLVDREDAGQATAAGAGIIAPGTSLRPLPDFYPFAARAVGFYLTLLERLVEDGEADTGYDTVGALFVAADEVAFAQLPQTLTLFEERRTAGMPNLGELTILTGAEARQRFPPLADIAGAIEIPEAARVDGRRLRDALRGAAKRRGATLVAGSAEPVLDGGRVSGVRIGNRVLPADALVIAGGAWSRELGDHLGLTVPVVPQRGQILHLALAGTDTVRWPIVLGAGQHYLLTFGPDRVVAGATREDGSGYDIHPTAAGVHEALSEALRVAPGLAIATIHEVRVGLRPVTPDGLPILGPLPGMPNIILATGHGPTGLQLGPYSGTLAADLVQGRPVVVDLTPFRVERFVGGTMTCDGR